MLDEHEIAGVLSRWAHARDVADWETLEACFHPDAMIRISWIHGTAAEFVERSKALAANRKPGMRNKHEITGPNIRINGARALGICHVHLLIRGMVDDYEVDLQSWFHFFDRIEKRDDVWRILQHTGWMWWTRAARPILCSTTWICPPSRNLANISSIFSARSGGGLSTTWSVSIRRKKPN
jgi:hypothetical protein